MEGVRWWAKPPGIEHQTDLALCDFKNRSTCDSISVYVHMYMHMCITHYIASQTGNELSLIHI